MMLRPDPTGFTASTTILGELAHQLRPCASCSSAQSDDQLDTVGVMNGSVLIEALSDGVSLSPTEAPRYVRELLAMRDPNHADLYEKAARGLARPQRSVASTLGIFAALPGTLKARILDLIAQSVRPKRPWQVQRELGLPRPPSAELSKLVTRGYFVSVRAGCYGIPGRDDGGGVVAKSNHAERRFPCEICYRREDMPTLYTRHPSGYLVTFDEVDRNKIEDAIAWLQEHGYRPNLP